MVGQKDMDALLYPSNISSSAPSAILLFCILLFHSSEPPHSSSRRSALLLNTLKEELLPTCLGMWVRLNMENIVFFVQIISPHQRCETMPTIGR